MTQTENWAQIQTQNQIHTQTQCQNQTQTLDCKTIENKQLTNLMRKWDSGQTPPGQPGCAQAGNSWFLVCWFLGGCLFVGCFVYACRDFVGCF